MNLKNNENKLKHLLKDGKIEVMNAKILNHSDLDLLQSVYGIENPSEYIKFEDTVMMDHTSFMDGYIDTTKVLDLNKRGANKRSVEGD